MSCKHIGIIIIIIFFLKLYTNVMILSIIMQSLIARPFVLLNKT